MTKIDWKRHGFIQHDSGFWHTRDGYRNLNFDVWQRGKIETLGNAVYLGIHKYHVFSNGIEFYSTDKNIGKESYIYVIACEVNNERCDFVIETKTENDFQKIVGKILDCIGYKGKTKNELYVYEVKSANSKNAKSYDSNEDALKALQHIKEPMKWNGKEWNISDGVMIRKKLDCRKNNTKITITIMGRNVFDIFEDDADKRFRNDVLGFIQHKTFALVRGIYTLDTHNRYLRNVNFKILDSNNFMDKHHSDFSDLAELGVKDVDFPKLDADNQAKIMLQISESFLNLLKNVRESLGCLESTIPATASEWLKRELCREQGINDVEFDAWFKGRVRKGNRSTWLDSDGAKISKLASDSYFGGLAVCVKPGYYEGNFSDYDLKSAYPFALGCLMQIDWKNPIAEEVIDGNGINLTLHNNSISDVAMGFAEYVHFEFPEDTKFPNIPIALNGSEHYIYPLEGDAECVTLFDVYTALKLGAKVKCKRLIYLNTIEDYPLRNAMKTLLDLRHSETNKAKSLIYKLACNSLYGKLAENLKSEKDGKLTNPLGCFATAYVRMIISLMINGISDYGFSVYSVMTDGFITDCNDKTFDLILNTVVDPNGELQKVSKELGNENLFECKHRFNTLLNISSTCNVSNEENGVIARGSFHSDKYDRDSLEAKNELAEIATRNGQVHFAQEEFTASNLLNSNKYCIRKVKRKSCFNYDFKRKITNTQNTMIVLPNGETRRYFRCNTEPWKNKDEAREFYKKIKSWNNQGKTIRCLEDVNVFMNNEKDNCEKAKSIIYWYECKMLNLQSWRNKTINERINQLNEVCDCNLSRRQYYSAMIMSDPVSIPELDEIIKKL